MQPTPEASHLHGTGMFMGYDGDAQSLYRQLLTDAKLRVTRVRMETIKLLARAGHALSAQEVFDALEAVDADRVTVYRTLNTLFDTGIAHRVDPGDRVFRFALTHDPANLTRPATAEHPHIHCERCSKIRCLYEAEIVVRPKETARARRTPWKLTSQDVVLRGYCDECESRPPVQARQRKG